MITLILAWIIASLLAGIILLALAYAITDGWEDWSTLIFIILIGALISGGAWSVNTLYKHYIKPQQAEKSF